MSKAARPHNTRADDPAFLLLKSCTSFLEHVRTVPTHRQKCKPCPALPAPAGRRGGRCGAESGLVRTGHSESVVLVLQAGGSGSASGPGWCPDVSPDLQVRVRLARSTVGGNFCLLQHHETLRGMVLFPVPPKSCVNVGTSHPALLISLSGAAPHPCPAFITGPEAHRSPQSRPWSCLCSGRCHCHL